MVETHPEERPTTLFAQALLPYSATTIAVAVDSLPVGEALQAQLKNTAASNLGKEKSVTEGRGFEGEGYLTEQR